MAEATENRLEAKALRSLKVLAGLAIAAALVATDPSAPESAGERT